MVQARAEVFDFVLGGLEIGDVRQEVEAVLDLMKSTAVGLLLREKVGEARMRELDSGYPQFNLERQLTRLVRHLIHVPSNVWAV